MHIVHSLRPTAQQSVKIKTEIIFDYSVKILTFAIVILFSEVAVSFHLLLWSSANVTTAGRNGIIFYKKFDSQTLIGKTYRAIIIAVKVRIIGLSVLTG